MAKCKSCAAPLSASSNVCTYCGVRNDIDLKGVHAYTEVAPDSLRICPKCEKPMRTIDLNIDGKFLIEQCEDCMGLFFDPGELEALLDNSVKNVFNIDYQKIHAINRELKTSNRDKMYIKCPVCGDMMNRLNYGARSGVVVDWCKDDGIFLDGGELKHLLEWTKAGGQILDEKKKQDDAAENEKKAAQKKRDARNKGNAYGPSNDAGYMFHSTRSSSSFNEGDIVHLIGRFISGLLR